ncbi:MAG: replication-relaxation family protein [Chloroflexota bacterium]|nr:replication-relaxation family protein [Chloroflexota bacterium]
MLMQQRGIFGTIAEKPMGGHGSRLTTRFISDTAMMKQPMTMNPRAAMTPTKVVSSAERKAQLPFRQRVAQPLNITAREVDVVLALYKYRLLTIDQLEVLAFFSATRTLKTKCKARLQKLYHNGYVARVLLPVFIGKGRRPTVYSIDEKGVALAVQQSGVEPQKITWLKADATYKDELHLDHDIALNNFWVVVERLAQDGYFQLVDGLTIYAFKSAPMKKQGKVPFIKKGAVVHWKEPDAYFAIQFADKPKPFHFFIEQDMGTKSKLYWIEKVKAYLKFRQDGLSAKHYDTKFFRVLTKTTNPKRLEKLITWTKEAGGDEYFWFTTETQMNIWQPTSFLAAIWQVVGKEGRFPLNVTSL